jgi:hypothetical protein
VINNTSIRRRWFGSVCLLIAIAMLVADEFLFKGRLHGVVFLAYWLGCFVFTVLAICAAWLDVLALRRSTRDEQRVLFENTLQNPQKKKAGETRDSE